LNIFQCVTAAYFVTFYYEGGIKHILQATATCINQIRYSFAPKAPRAVSARRGSDFEMR